MRPYGAQHYFFGVSWYEAQDSTRHRLKACRAAQIEIFSNYRPEVVPPVQGGKIMSFVTVTTKR
jgi:hypothetical protein